jgi:hypothetical protein
MMNSDLCLAITPAIQTSGLLLGVASILAGLLLMRAHRSSFQAIAGKDPSPGLFRFEFKKMRRRTLIAALVASIGCMLVSLHWVNEIKVLAFFSLAIMLQLLLILGFAMVDIFSVGIRTLTRIDERPHKEMIEQMLHQHQAGSQKSSGDSPDNSSPQT